MDEKATHAYCPHCEEIQVAVFDELRGVSSDGSYLAGDILCAACDFVIATLFKERV